MRMSDVKVGMRLRSTVAGDVFSPITVTAITERGFQYSLDRERCIHPRLGMTVEKDGHEHYGHDGEAFYEPVEAAAANNKYGKYTEVKIKTADFEHNSIIDPARLAQVTFCTKERPGGDMTVIPREELVDWVRRWLLP